MNLWDEEVLKERAKIHAQRNPQPPLPSWQQVLVAVLAIAATAVTCAAWGALLK